MNIVIIVCVSFIALLLLSILVGALFDWSKKKEEQIEYLQKAFSVFGKLFGIDVSISPYDGEMYFSTYSKDARENLQPVRKDDFEKFKKETDERFDALAKHLGVRFKRETTQPTDEVVAIKLK